MFAKLHFFGLLTLLLAAPAHAEDPWLEAVHAKVDHIWGGSFLLDCDRHLPPGHALHDKSIVTLLRLTLSNEGLLVESVVEKSSGHPDWDASALEVAKAASPLPAAPQSVWSDDAQVRLIWAFPRDRSKGGPKSSRVDRVALPLAEAVPKLLEQGRWGRALERLADPKATPTTEQVSAVTGAILAAGLSDPKAQAATLQAIIAGRAQGVAGLGELLANQKAPPPIRAAAAEALGLQGQAGKAQLIKLLAELPSRLASAAASGLAAMGAADEGWASIKGRTGADLAKALKAAMSLGAPSSVEALVAELANPSLAHRVLAAEALGAAAQGKDGPAVAALKKAVAGEEPRLRAAAARGITRVGRAGLKSKGLFYRVIPLLQKGTPDEKASALIAAGAVGREKASGDLVLLSKKVKSPALRAAAAEGLGLIPTEEARARLEVLLKSDSAEVRRAALLALAGRSDAQAAVKAASTQGLSLTDADELQLLAAGMGPKPPIAALDAALQDADARMRSLVVGAWLSQQ